LAVPLGDLISVGSSRKDSGPMFLMLSKGPRKSNRTRSKRYRAKLKAKNRGRRNRVYGRT